jgi:hypothetical protein
MSSPRLLGVIGLTASLALLPVAPAESQQSSSQQNSSQQNSSQQNSSQQKKEADKKAAAPVVAAPVYKPPLRGAPGGRLGGGTRGTGRDVFVLSVLAPDHSGLTQHEQPSLYWYISNPTALPVEFTIMDPTAVQPLLEMRIPGPISAGIHEIRLADHGIRLAPDAVYRWYVAVVPDSGRRSRDILAGGTIQRITLAPDVAAKLQARPADEAPFIYAEAGLWYDALAAMSALIQRNPENSELRQRRAALVAQVGLPSVAGQ